MIQTGLYSLGLGERPGNVPPAHPEALLQPAAGSFPGDRWAGERARAGEERVGHPASAPQSASQH